MKRIYFLLLLAFTGCSSNEEKNSSELGSKNELILHGKWSSKGNAGLEPHFLLLDSASGSYYRWLEKEEKPEMATGTFELDSQILELRHGEYMDVQNYKIDTLTSGYMRLSPLGPSAGDLVYQRTSINE